MKIVVVGYGPGGTAAAVSARMFDSNADIMILTEETLDCHRKPGASLALEYPDTDELKIRDWSIESLGKKRIVVRTGTTVIGGDTESNSLRIKDNTGESIVGYDQLILAIGGNPNLPKIPGIELQGVFTIQTMADTSQIGHQLSEMNSVTIVGAGFSGLETAERLLDLGKETHLVIRSRLMRRQLEEPMSSELASRMPRALIIHHDNPTLVIGTKCVEGLSLKEKEISTDAVLFMTGVRPNTGLAQSLGLKIGDLGGILVNDKMQTSVENIYAVGDCVEARDPYSGKNLLLPIGSVAARAGRQAGVAAVGGTKIYSDYSKHLQYDRIFGTDVVVVGHSSTTAKDVGAKTMVQYVEDPAEFAKVALILDLKGQLIGGQVIASRMGARLGYEILDRVESGSILKDKPLLKPRHERLRNYLESTFGPIQ